MWSAIQKIIIRIFDERMNSYPKDTTRPTSKSVRHGIKKNEGNKDFDYRFGSLAWELVFLLAFYYFHLDLLTNQNQKKRTVSNTIHILNCNGTHSINGEWSNQYRFIRFMCFKTIFYLFTANKPIYSNHIWSRM